MSLPGYFSCLVSYEDVLFIICELQGSSSLGDCSKTKRGGGAGDKVRERRGEGEMKRGGERGEMNRGGEVSDEVSEGRDEERERGMKRGDRDEMMRRRGEGRDEEKERGRDEGGEKERGRDEGGERGRCHHVNVILTPYCDPF